MYKCNHCGEEFEVPRTERQLMGEYFGDKAYENYEVCPECGSDEWDEKKNKGDLEDESI